MLGPTKVLSVLHTVRRVKHVVWLVMTEWVALFDEAVVWATAYQLRNMFMAVVGYCDLGNVRVIFDTYILEVQTCKIDDLTLKNNLLKELSYMFCSNGLSLSTYDLPVPSDNSMIIP